MVLNLVGAASVPEPLASLISRAGLGVAEATTTHLGGSLLPLEKDGWPLPSTVVTALVLIPSNDQQEQ